MKPGAKKKIDCNSIGIFKTLDFGAFSYLAGQSQNVFVYINNGADGGDGFFKIHAFLIDAPKKAVNLSFQTKVKNFQVATLFMGTSGPMNAIDELNPQPCFRMTSEEEQKYSGVVDGCKRTYLEFQVLDQTPKNIRFGFGLQKL